LEECTAARRGRLATGLTPRSLLKYPSDDVRIVR
jgi:hypothetical protein